MNLYDWEALRFNFTGYKTFILGDDNSLTPIEDADHKNVWLLGRIGERAVVMATWKREEEGVSAVNDGYLTVDPDGSLSKIFPYVFANDMMIYNDHLYLLLWRNDTVIDATTGEEIAF